MPVLKYPLFYCLAGAALALFPSVRAGWEGLLALGGLISLYGFFAKGEKSDAAVRHKVGDDCYFIGFVYTLVVITATLVLDVDALLGESGSGGDLRPILTTVGVALGTSVVGMMWRFFLVHGVETPEHEFESHVSRVARAADQLTGTVERVGDSVREVESSMKSTAKSMAAYAVRVEEESWKVGGAMKRVADELLEDFGRKIADALQTTHFEGVREALHSAVEEHRAAISQVVAAMRHSLAELDGAAKISAANVEAVSGALAALESAVGEGRMSATHSAIRGFAEQVEKLNEGLRLLGDGALDGGKLSGLIAAMRNFGEQVETLNGNLRGLAEKQAEAVGAAGRDLERLRKVRDAFDELMKSISGDAEAVAKIKEDYRREFDKAASAALKETHELYARLIGGANLALAGLDNLQMLAADLRKVAQELERREGDA